MKLLQVNVTDRVGERFNGLATQSALAAAGIESTHLVWNRTVDAPHVQTLLPYPGMRAFNAAANRLEERWSLKAMLQAQTFAVPVQSTFRQADLVHYQIIQDGYFTLQALPLLTRLKPSVWTWHDPWPMTGHCLHPIDCPGWLRRCGGCPDLDRYYPMREDKTALNARLKQGVYARSRFDVIVASQWMADMAARSPLAEHLQIHVVPFGLDPAVYRPSNKAAAREALGIEPGRTVVALRAKSGGFKGLADLKAVIAGLSASPPLAILALDETGHFDSLLGGPHQVIDLGHVIDGDAMARNLAAADLFVMPSHADSFGLMAVEAMACALPVIVYEGTALPATVRAPDVGVAVPRGNRAALSSALERLIADPDERARRGARGRALVEAEYSTEQHVRRLVAVYDSVMARRGRTAPQRRSIEAVAPRPDEAEVEDRLHAVERHRARQLHATDKFVIGHVGAVRREGVRQLLELLAEQNWRLNGRVVHLHAFGEGFSAHGIPEGVLEVSTADIGRMADCDVVYVDAAAPAAEVSAAVAAALSVARPLVVRGAGPRDVIARVGGTPVGLHAPGPQAAPLFDALRRLAEDSQLYARLADGAASAKPSRGSGVDGWTPAASRPLAPPQPHEVPRAKVRRFIQTLAAPRRSWLDLSNGWEVQRNLVGPAAMRKTSIATNLDPWDYVAALNLPDDAAKARWLTLNIASQEEVYLLLVDDGWAGVGERRAVYPSPVGSLVRFDLKAAPDARRLVIQAGPSPERGEIRISDASLRAPL